MSTGKKILIIINVIAGVVLFLASIFMSLIATEGIMPFTFIPQFLYSQCAFTFMSLIVYYLARIAVALETLDSDPKEDPPEKK